MRTCRTATVYIFALNCNQLFKLGSGFFVQPSSKNRVSYFTNLPAEKQTHQQRCNIVCTSSIVDDLSKELFISGNDHTGNSHINHVISHFSGDSVRASPTNAKIKKKKNIPKKPRVFKHLYRYFTDISVECWLATVSPDDFIQSCGYSKKEIGEMSEKFPRLLSSLDVRGHLAPKMRFLVRTLGAGKGDICSGVVDDNKSEIDDANEIYCPHNLMISNTAKANIPPQFFGIALERTAAPRHAYIAYKAESLPHGKELLAHNAQFLKEFVEVCNKPNADFISLCNRWSNEGTKGLNSSPHTIEKFESFERAFCSGLMSTARTENLSDLNQIGCSRGRMVELQLEHGANPIEADICGVSPLQWLAGTGNLGGTKALLDALLLAGEGEDVGDIILNARKAKNAATSLHWACAGIRGKTFGCGGHIDICKLLLNEAGDKKTDLVNAGTTTGSTPLMWASWAGSLDIVKFLLSNNANPYAEDHTGANAADWALKGGNISICKYLNENFEIECSTFGP